MHIHASTYVPLPAEDSESVSNVAVGNSAQGLDLNKIIVFLIEICLPHIPLRIYFDFFSIYFHIFVCTNPYAVTFS